MVNEITFYNEIFYGIENSGLDKMADAIIDKILLSCGGISNLKSYSSPEKVGDDKVSVKFETVSGVKSVAVLCFSVETPKMPV